MLPKRRRVTTLQERAPSRRSAHSNHRHMRFPVATASRQSTACRRAPSSASSADATVQRRNVIDRHRTARSGQRLTARGSQVYVVQWCTVATGVCCRAEATVVRCMVWCGVVRCAGRRGHTRAEHDALRRVLAAAGRWVGGWGTQWGGPSMPAMAATVW